MLTQALLLAALPTLALANPQPMGNRVLRCSNTELTQEQKDLYLKIATHKKDALGDAFEIPTYFHVVQEDETTGALSDDTLAAQLKVLNDDYAPQSISFSLQETTRTINKDWATNLDGDNMRRTLRKGSYNALNLFFLTNPDGALGYCSLPFNNEPGSDITGDGCAIGSGTLPGGNPPYNLGRTATHEIGHWLGLPHTFDNGCSDPGDGIDDTPYEAEATFGCPTGQDSCPDREGLDPIQNYMDYTDDGCMSEFSPQQGARMHDAWYNIRIPSSQ